MDPGDELVRPEGLGQVVVASELEPEDLVDFLFLLSGQDDGRDLASGLAELPADLEARPGPA